MISTHTPLARRDSVNVVDSLSSPRFLLTRLLRGATRSGGRHQYRSGFLLTRLLRGATAPGLYTGENLPISTHTPLARRDKQNKMYSQADRLFLLTRLLRGATSRSTEQAGYSLDFYSHASCEARPCRMEAQTASMTISTHTPLARRDEMLGIPVLDHIDFYSHASCEARHLQVITTTAIK